MSTNVAHSMALICGEIEDSMRRRDSGVDVRLHDTGQSMAPDEWLDSYQSWRALAMYYEVQADGPQVTYTNQVGVYKQ